MNKKYKTSISFLGIFLIYLVCVPTINITQLNIQVQNDSITRISTLRQWNIRYVLTKSIKKIPNRFNNYDLYFSTPNNDVYNYYINNYYIDQDNKISRNGTYLEYKVTLNKMNNKFIYC
ncbi:MAG: hypothetical protein N4A63_03050 [Vallitalea sp.]|jgi:hypothetical protein|nr:hypothetical protein [Vallitalea sp.]